MFRKIYLLLIVLVFSRLLYAQDEVKIDLGKEHQTIDNFAASDCWSMQKIGAWALPQKERVADLLFSVDKGIGLSAWRFNIGGGMNPYINHSWRTVETFEVEQGVYDWSRQEEEQVLAMREDGASCKAIAKILGRSTKAVYTRIHLMNKKGMIRSELKIGEEQLDKSF